jgi:integrase
LDAIEVAAAQKALRVVVGRDLWKGTNTNARSRRKKEPERILAKLGTKLENYRRCRERQALNSPKNKVYLKRKARWKRFTNWLRLALKSESNTTGFKGNVPRATSCEPVTESIKNADPLFEMLCKMLEKAARAYQAELRAVVRSVRQALRRSSLHYQISLEEAVENPQKAIDVLRLFIRKNSTLRKHLKLEYESPDVQQSTRGEKFRRALVLQEDGGASIGSDDKEHKRAVSPNLGVTAPSNYSQIKPMIPDLTIAVANGKGSVGGATIDSKTAATANRYRAVFSLVYREAVRNGTVPSNPARLVRQRQESSGRIRYLLDEEEDRLCKWIVELFPEHMPELTIAVGTGMRKGEQYGLIWKRVDFNKREVHLAKTKNGEARDVPMSVEVLAAFQQVKPTKVKPTDSVFATPNPREWFEAVREKAKLDDFRWHDCRHTFCSRLAMAGVPLKTIQILAGHKTISITARYAHLAPNTLHTAVELIYVPGYKPEQSPRKYHQQTVQDFHRAGRACLSIM